MPNYEIVHDQVGPFPRRIFSVVDGVRTLKVDDKGNPVSRVVTEAAINKTSPKTDRFEGNLTAWLRVGAIKPTDAPETTEPMEEDGLNSRTVVGSPAHKEFVAGQIGRIGSQSAATPATTATAVKN